MGVTPPDERYASVHALYEAARARRARTEERDIDTAAFRTEAVTTDDLVLREASGRTAALTHWSFGQFATIASAPPHYLRTLPALIASSAINYGLQRQRRDQHTLFVERTAPWTVHAVTSQRYARVHHDELASRVLDLMVLHPAWHLPLGYKDGEFGAERVPSGAQGIHERVRFAMNLSQSVPLQAVEQSPWLTVDEAAQRARCGVKTIYREVRAGRLRAARVGGRRELRLLSAWVDEWLVRSTTATVA